MKNRLLFLFIFLILTISFIITGAYYLLVLIMILTSLIFVSLLTMLCFSNSISIEIIDKGEDTYLVYKSKGLPIGKLSIQLNIENLFFEEIFNNKFEMVLGEKQLSMKIPFNKNHLGKYVVNEQKIVLSDFLGIFKKRIKNELLSEMIQYPNFNNSNIDMYKISEQVIAHQSNKSDDYDIREYRIGDSLKDIHYKMSYKLSNYMIKEKHKNQSNSVSVLLDLSGDNESCEKVFAHLYHLILNLQVYHESCLVKWVSNQQLYEQKINDMNDYKNCLITILSMPKCKEIMNVSSTWIITSIGLK